MIASIITGHLVSVFYSQPHRTLTTTLGGEYFISILQMRVLRISKMVQIPPGHLASKQQSWGSTLNLLALKPWLPSLGYAVCQPQGNGTDRSCMD